MPNLNVYVNGTPGGTDGTLIDPTAGALDVSGIYPISGVAKYIYLPLCLRCNTGFRATSVRLTPLDSNFRFISTSNNYIFTFDTFEQVDGMSPYSLSYSSSTCALGQFSNPSTERSVSNTNVLFFGAYYFYGTPTAGTRNMFSVSFVENVV